MSWPRSQAAAHAGSERSRSTGRDGGAVGRAAEIHVNVPSDSTARVQEVHRTLLHVICELVERRLLRMRHGMGAVVASDGRMPELRTETMTVNMGPQHPSTHGVLRLVLELDGETVRSVSPTIGYLHTGIEKTAEQKKWQQVIPLVERMDYLSAQSNSMAFCLSVETLLGIEMPERVPMDSRPHRRAAAHQQPSRLAGHARHGSRRRVGDAVLLPRARTAAQHQRAAGRLPDVPELHARRRPPRRSAARISRRGRARSSIAFRRSSTSTKIC